MASGVSPSLFLASAAQPCRCLRATPGLAQPFGVSCTRDRAGVARLDPRHNAASLQRRLYNPIYLWHTLIVFYWPDPSKAIIPTRPERSPWSAGACSVAGILRTLTRDTGAEKKVFHLKNSGRLRGNRAVPQRTASCSVRRVEGGGTPGPAGRGCVGALGCGARQVLIGPCSSQIPAP